MLIIDQCPTLRTGIFSILKESYHPSKFDEAGEACTFCTQLKKQNRYSVILESHQMQFCDSAKVTYCAKGQKLTRGHNNAVTETSVLGYILLIAV